MLSTSLHGARRQTPELRVGCGQHVSLNRTWWAGSCGTMESQHVPLVQILDALVPQMEDQVADNVLDVARLLDLPIA